MENKCKRFLSLLLALVMVLGMMPVGRVDATENTHFLENSNPVTSVNNLVNGTYVIYSYLEAYVMNQADKDNPNYIDLGAVPTVWNVQNVSEVLEATEGDWTFQYITCSITDGNGNYLYVNDSKAGVTTDETTLRLVYGNGGDTPNQNGFLIRNANDNYNLNNGGNITSAKGTGGKGSWSRWQFRPCSGKFENMIPVDDLEVTAGSVETDDGGTTEGPAAFAVDNNLNTMWHTEYNGSERDVQWFQFELNKDYAVDGLYYKPRSDAGNGTITECQIQVSNDGKTFTSVTEDNIHWEQNVGWKGVTFEPKAVKYVRLKVVNASGNWASAAEIRLTGVQHEHDWQTDGTCGRDGCAERWVYTNISMENDLEVHFAIRKDLVADWNNCYAEIVKEYADDRDDVTTTVPYSETEWKQADIDGDGTYDDYHYVTFTGVAAKEMSDEFRVAIYENQGEGNRRVPVSPEYVDSIRSYAHRSLANDPSSENTTMIVDMLNYGAEAQKAFGYNDSADNLANADLTAEQQVIGNVDCEDNRVLTGCPVDYMANVKMENNLQFMMAFSGINETMSAEITFEHWNEPGETTTVTIPGSEFVESGRFHYFTIEETVVADGRQLITCEIKDSEGNTVAVVEDSIESYVSRTTQNRDLYQAIMKFSDSARAYLEAKNNPETTQ